MPATERGQIAFYSTCAACGGSGVRSALSSCRDCGGLGTYYLNKGDLIVWKYGLDAVHIVFRRWNVLVGHVVDAALFGFLVVNVAILAIVGNDLNFESDKWFEAFAYSTQTAVGLFWLFSFFNMYLFYRIVRVLTTHRGKIERAPVRQSKPKVQNIAAVMSHALANTVDRAWIDVHASQRLPIRPLHLLEALIDDRDIVMILARLGIHSEQIRETIHRQTAALAPAVSDDALSESARDVLLNAYLAAVADRASTVRTTDLLEAIVKLDAVAQDILYEHDVDQTKIFNVIRWINLNNELMKRVRRFRTRAVSKPKGPINRAFTAAATPYLDSFSTDLTQMARVGRLSLSVARERELAEVYRVLEGGRSALLVGENGVGKFNIIEALANLMVAEDVPAMLQDKRLVSLSVPFLVAGAARTGEVQERMLLIMQEVMRSGNIVLVIEDVHNIVGVSSAGAESIDLSDVAAQEIQNGAVSVIATTSPREMTEYVEPSALSGVFERVTVLEPDRNQTIQILEANVGLVEGRREVFFTYSSLEKLVDFSDRYLHDQFLPAKALSLMAEVASWVAQRESRIVTAEDIAQLVSQKTNIPLTQVTKKESDVLLHLEEIIHKRFIDQEEAVQMVVSALRRARAELRDQDRPIVNLLFLGPTGVGKTELAKTVAATYFGDEQAMVRLDMSEYQAQDSLARLLGAPGSGHGGVLTEAIRNRPFALLLLDEIEKAHPEILNIFLQVMDDARLTDGLGRTVDFTNVILVATSNAQANFIQDEVRKNTPVESIKDELLRNRLRDTFRPEFLNRFDGIVVFKPLSSDDIFKVAGLMLRKVEDRLAAKGIFLTVTPEAQNELAQAGFDPMFGARPLRRVIQDRVEESLATYLLDGKISRRDTVTLEKGGRITVQKAEHL